MGDGRCGGSVCKALLQRLHASALRLELAAAELRVAITFWTGWMCPTSDTASCRQSSQARRWDWHGHYSPHNETVITSADLL